MKNISTGSIKKIEVVENNYETFYIASFGDNLEDFGQMEVDLNDFADFTASLFQMDEDEREWVKDVVWADEMDGYTMIEQALEAYFIANQNDRQVEL